MKKVLIAIALTAVLSSCNVQKQVTRQDVTASSISESKEAMASRLKKQTKTDARTTKDIRTTESCDTVLNIPGSTLSRTTNLDYLMSNGTLNLESATVVGTLTLDTTSGRVVFSVIEKPRLIPHSFNRVTDTRETEVKNIAQDEDVKTTASQSQVNKANSEISSVAKDVRRAIPWWLIPICVIIAVVVFVIFKEAHKRFL